MLLIIQILLFASFLALRARPFDQDIDLNQPASPAEESPTEIMIVSYLSKKATFVVHRIFYLFF